MPQSNPNSNAVSAPEASSTEDAALASLQHRDMPAVEIEMLARDSHLMKSRKVLLALVRHPSAPKHVALPLVRQLFAFELMQLALTPAIPSDIKTLAENCTVSKIPTLSVGERLTLAKRGSTRVAAALLNDSDGRVRDAALKNPYMTEMWVIRALTKSGATGSLIQAVRRHAKWSCRIEVKRALEGLTNRPAGQEFTTGREQN